MSSRRGAGEDNILAMLERDSARRAGPRMSGLRLAWYGAGAALCGILVGGVAWLAYDNQQAGSPLQAQVDVAASAVEAQATHASPPQAPAAGSLSAVIVDERPRMRTAPPPLVMLPPHEVAASRPTAAPPTREKAPEAAIVLAAPDAAVSSGPRMTPRVPGAEPARPLAGAPDKRAHRPARAKPGAKPADAKPAARRTALAKAGGSAGASQAALPRGRKPAAQPAPEPQLDGDVALISAIISQSDRHRGEREDVAPCAGGKCGAKAPRP